MITAYLKTKHGTSTYREDLPHECAVDVLNQFAEDHKRRGWRVEYIGAERVKITSANPLQDGCELYLRSWGQA